jgi:hypothetical protein
MNMSISGLDPMLVTFQQRQQELIKEAAQYHLLKEAYPDGMPKIRSTSKILALIGRELTCLGLRLEKRYSIQV